MSYRKRNVLAASGLALLAVIFTLIYISKARSGSTPSGHVTVLVASHDIAAGTLGSTLQSSAFVSKRVPADAAVPDRIGSPGEISSQIVTEDILRGEQVTSRRFGPRAEVGVRSDLQRRERVVQLLGDPSQVLDGTLKAGDRVDVLATWNVPEKCSYCHVSRVIVRNALVLETNADLSVPKAANGSVPVQLRLTDAEAERVFWMVKNGEWWLALRPVTHPGSSSQGFDSAGSILQSQLSRRGPSR